MLPRSASSPIPPPMPSSLYNCHVFHKRFSPQVYGFTSRIFMWHLDLAEIPALAGRLPLLSHNAPNVYSFRDDDHLYLGFPTLRENVCAYLQQEGLETPPGRISLLTNLRTFGYVFNPVSFYFIEDPEEQPLAVLVEVHNTYGELKPFLLKREDSQGNRFTRRHPKLFYISPFSELDEELEIKVVVPGDRLAIQVNNRRKGEASPFFRSSLTGHRVALTSASLAGYSVRFPLITCKVIALIHWHALRLYLKRVPLIGKKTNPHLQKGIFPKKDQTLDIPTT